MGVENSYLGPLSEDCGHRHLSNKWYGLRGEGRARTGRLGKGLMKALAERMVVRLTLQQKKAAGSPPVERARLVLKARIEWWCGS